MTTPRCQGTNRRGEPCSRPPTRGSEYCNAHDPSLPAEQRFGSPEQQARRGGSRGGRPRVARPTEVKRRLVEEGALEALYGPYLRRLVEEIVRSVLGEMTSGRAPKVQVQSRRTRHGDAARGQTSPEYTAWKNIKQRIFNPAHPDFRNYGGRGLTMTPEWATSFEAFLRDVGRRPADHLTIERINNDLGYIPGNVTWATREAQARNSRRRKAA
jgi:hypothetical protein